MWVWGGQWSFHQHSVCRGTESLWPSCELSGGLQRPNREARGHHSCSSQTMHCIAHSTQRRKPPQAAHMSLYVITQHRTLCNFFFIPFMNFFSCICFTQVQLVSNEDICLQLIFCVMHTFCMKYRSIQYKHFLLGITIKTICCIQHFHAIC